MYPPNPQAPVEPPPLEMSEDECGKWWKRITFARQRRKREETKWKRLLQAYLPPRDPSADINSNVHFRNVHLKIAEVFAQFPELQLTPLEPLSHLKDPATGQPFMDAQGQPMNPSALAAHIVTVKRAVLNKLLGSDYADVDQTILECLFDIFCTSGIGATKICYESDIQQIPQETPGPETAMPGSVLNLQPVAGPPVVTMKPVPVNERVRWYRFSPNAFLQPHDNHSTRWDEVSWLGMEFKEPLNQRTREHYQLPEKFAGSVAGDDLIVSDGYQDPRETTTDSIKGIEVWLHAADFDPNVADKDVFYRLVLIEGLTDRPAIYERSPYQSIGPEDGRLTADSVLGNPIHPISLRVATDLAWIPSDSAFTDPLVRQENTWLAQSVKQRDSNIPRFMHSDKISEAVDKLKLMDVGQGIAIPEEAMMQGAERLIAQIPHLESAQADVQGHAMIRRAMDETLGTRNQAATVNTGRVSATESAVVDRNISVRLKGEQKNLMTRILQGVRKFDQLAMRYLSPQFVSLAGEAGANLLVMVNRQMIAVRCQYDAHPDTMVTTDAKALQDKWEHFTNFMAKSAYLNQEENARNGALAFGYDPTKLIVKPPPPPEPPPEQAKISVALKAEDLALPEARILLKATGIDLGPVSPEAIAVHLAAQQKQNENQPHGGAADRADLLSEHHSEKTGLQDGRPPVAPAPPQKAAPGAGLH